jgi:hypothetical protein
MEMNKRVFTEQAGMEESLIFGPKLLRTPKGDIFHAV